MASLRPVVTSAPPLTQGLSQARRLLLFSSPRRYPAANPTPPASCAALFAHSAHPRPPTYPPT
jgi:hypothetical protein